MQPQLHEEVSRVLEPKVVSAERRGRLKMAIRIKNLRLETILGLRDSERVRKRAVIINVLLELESNEAAAHDSIDGTVDYSMVRDEILRRVEGSEFKLIESLAQDILDHLITDARISSVVVEVDKPGALRYAESVSVQLSWQRENYLHGISEVAD